MINLFEYFKFKFQPILSLIIITSSIYVITFVQFALSTSIKLKTETTNNNNLYQRKIDNTSYNAIINGEIALPCNITSPSFDDSVSLVLWYRDDISTPIYTVDSRQSTTLANAQHFLHTDIFDQRATFNISYPLAFLIIKNVRSSDGGDYRCRVDFRRARTINRILKLTVIVPTTSVIIYDRNFTQIDQIAGPFVEDSTQSLICDSSEGNPLPVVHWWRDTNLIDSDYFIINNTISRNVLTLTNLSRDDLQSTFTCQAYNTNLTVPITKTVQLDLYLKPKEIRIIAPMNSNNNQSLSYPTSISLSTTPIELACQCFGSRPSARIRWRKVHRNSLTSLNNTQDIQSDSNDLKEFSQIITNDGLTTTSFLSYVPSIDDNNKIILCIGYNPKISENIYSINYSWPINITYSPILSLIMGSDSRSQDIVEGSNVYFECDIKANPYVTNFGWKLNGQMLNMVNNNSNNSNTTTEAATLLNNNNNNSNNDETMTSNDQTLSRKNNVNVDSNVKISNTSLLITNVNHEHYGHYQCFASNQIGSSQSESVFLNVKYIPKCKYSNKMIALGVAIDETINIECEIIANPSINLKFEWWLELINDNNINSNNGNEDSSSSSSTNITSSKTIKKLINTNSLQNWIKYRPKSINDYGRLYCFAMNSLGKQRQPCIYHIIQAEPPNHPHNCTLINKTTHSLTVECSPGYSGGLNQTFYLEVYALNPLKLLKNLTNEQQPYFRIDNLPSGFLFKLVIYSSNRKGISKSIEITGSTTEPSPWKSDEYPKNNHHNHQDVTTNISMTLLTPFLLIIIVIIIIVILLIALSLHIHKHIKGRTLRINSNVQSLEQHQHHQQLPNQYYQYHHHNHKPMAGPVTNIKPKSIMKKQKIWNISTDDNITNNNNNQSILPSSNHLLSSSSNSIIHTTVSMNNLNNLNNNPSQNSRMIMLNNGIDGDDDGIGYRIGRINGSTNNESIEIINDNVGGGGDAKLLHSLNSDAVNNNIQSTFNVFECLNIDNHNHNHHHHNYDDDDRNQLISSIITNHQQQQQQHQPTPTPSQSIVPYSTNSNDNNLLFTTSSSASATATTIVPLSSLSSSISSSSPPAAPPPASSSINPSIFTTSTTTTTAELSDQTNSSSLSMMLSTPPPPPPPAPTTTLGPPLPSSQTLQNHFTDQHQFIDVNKHNDQNIETLLQPLNNSTMMNQSKLNDEYTMILGPIAPDPAPAATTTTKTSLNHKKVEIIS